MIATLKQSHARQVTRKKFVSVVGAGWAGLSAAYRLVKLGHEVTLYEAAPQVGGRARGLRLNLLGHERELDNGQHLLIGAYTQTLGLRSDALNTLGVDVKDHYASQRTSPFLLQEATPSTLGIGQPPRFAAGQASSGSSARVKSLHFGRWAAADQSRWLAWLPQAGTALGLLVARGLSFTDKLAFVRLMRTLQRVKFQGFEGLTVLKLLHASGQPEALIIRVWEPLCISALNTGLDRACAQTFVNVLQDSLAASGSASRVDPLGSLREPAMHRAFPSDYVIPQQDLSRYFAEPLLAAFQKLGGRLQLRHVIRSIDELESDWVVLAVPPFAAANILSTNEGFCHAQSALISRLQQFEYQSITTVYLAWDQALPAIDTGPYLLREEAAESAYGQWLFGRGFENGVQVAAVVVSARGRYAELDTETLSANIARQVQRQTGLPLAQAWRAITEKRATFSCVPDRPLLGSAELSFSLDAGSDKQIFLAGDYCYSRYPATLESASYGSFSSSIS